MRDKEEVEKCTDTQTGTHSRVDVTHQLCHLRPPDTYPTKEVSTDLAGYRTKVPSP